MSKVFKISGGLAILMIAALMCLPYLLATDYARKELARSLSAELGADVKIASCSLGWFSGLRLEGVVIDQVSEHTDSSVPEAILRLDLIELDLGIASLLRNRIDIEATITGLDLHLIRNADGQSNFRDICQKLFGSDRIDHDAGDWSADDETDDILGRLRLDLEIRDSNFELFDTEHGLLESIEAIHVRLSKNFDSTKLRLDCSADFPRPDMPNQPGRIQILGHMGPESVDLIDLEFHCSGLQLDRYQALLRTFLPEEQVTEFSGQLRADCRMHSDQDRNLKINGLIEIAKPRFAGELFAGMNLASERWHLRPNIQARLDSDWKIDDADASQFEADLGFLQVQGQRGTGSELVFAFEADLNEIAEQRASNAADLPIDIGKVKGEVAMSDGVVEILVNSAEVSHGQLQCNARIEPFAEAEIPIHLAMNLTGGEATVRNIGLLKYLVPFMAGSESAGLVNFKSALDFKVEVDGHFDPQRHTSLAAMLNVLEGKGSLNLRGGSFMPADELSRLFSLLGRREALELRDLVSEFTLNHGQIETSLLELNSKGRKFHMNGTTTLAGVIDYQIDASDLLRGHRDGDKILAYLGNSGLQARLTGTIDAPSLDMPSFSELLSKAAGNALEDKAGEGLDRLLRKLFKKKR